MDLGFDLARMYFGVELFLFYYCFELCVCWTCCLFCIGVYLLCDLVSFGCILMFCFVYLGLNGSVWCAFVGYV